MTIKKIYLYPYWIRLWHSINAIMFLALIFTGISLHFGEESGSAFLNFNLSVAIHNVAAIVVTIGYVYYVAGNIISHNSRHYRHKGGSLMGDLMKQFRFYAGGIFKGEPHPFPVTEEQKFNPLQRFSYVLAMYVGMPLLIISGFGLLFPEIVIFQVFGISGLALTDLLHIIMGFVLSIFLVIHLYTCTLGDKPGTLFKSMITGYHEEEEHN